MKISRAALAALPLLFCMTGAAQADDTFVYGKLGLGAGIGIGTRLNDNFSIRGGINGSASHMYDRTIGSTSYDFKPKLDGSLEAMVDWFPRADSGFRVTGGLMYLKNMREDLRATTNSSGQYILNNHTYSAGEVGELSGKISYNKIAPYFGVGWESSRDSKKGWRFMSDAGVMMIGGGSTSLSASGGANNAALRQDVEAERKRVGSDSGDKRRFAAILSIGAAYAF